MFGKLNVWLLSLNGLHVPLMSGLAINVEFVWTKIRQK